MIEESVNYVATVTTKMKKVAGSYGTALLDMVVLLGSIIKKILRAHTAPRVQYACNVFTNAARHLESETRNYFIHNFFGSVKTGPVSGRPKLVLIA